MAITPKAAASLTRADLGEVSKLELAIDKFLSENYRPDASTFPAFVFRDRPPSQRIIDELIRRYEAADWEKVRYETGQNGTFLQFYDRIISEG
jgi:hypothetical protein